MQHPRQTESEAIIDMFAFHCEVPEGAEELEIRLDYLSSEIESKVSTGKLASGGTAKVLNVNWESMLLYPKGQKIEDIMYQATIRLPNGWKYATA